MFRILSDKARDKKIVLPGSKSVTHRILILASLNDGTTEILNPLYSEDTEITINALRSFGAKIETRENKILVSGSIGKVSDNKIFLGNSGSSARFLIPLVKFLDKEIYFYGSDELYKRPFAELFSLLEKIGYRIESENDSLPATVFPPNKILTDKIETEKLPSSQIISGLMMAFAKSENGLKLKAKEKIPSFPYVKMTSQLMRRLDLRNEIFDDKIKVFPNKKINYEWKFSCERDLSAASYWVAYALINDVNVAFENLLLPSLQGDEAIFEIAEKIGGKVKLNSNGAEVSGKIINGLIYDCEDIPDIVPTLAVMGMFAPERFVLKNVSRLKYKESDRINSVVENITALGGKCEYVEPDLIVYPQKNYNGATIKIFNDHRIAMSFAIAGTKIKNVVIDKPDVVEKSYPNFWEDFTEFENVR